MDLPTRQLQDGSQGGARSNPAWTFPAKVALVTVVVVLALLIWQLSNFLLVAFGAIILATALRALSDVLEKRLRMPTGWSVLAAVLAVLALLAGGVALVGDPLAEQFQRLREGLPAAVDAAWAWLNDSRIGTAALQYFETIKDDATPSANRLAGVAGVTFGALGGAGLMLVMAVFLAASPQVYREGLIRLVPVAQRPLAADALDASGHALSRWLLGQSISMLFVGATTTIGLLLLDVPLAFAVGILSGLLAFIPFFGAIAGGLLAVLLAFMEGPQTALYVGILAVAIQQVEGQLLMPFVQRWAVSLPPVMSVAAAVVFGVLFGTLGVLVATPAMVVLMVLVKRLYIDAVLEAGIAS